MNDENPAAIERDGSERPYSLEVPAELLAPPPWCRVCHKAVSWFEYERLPDRRWSFDVICHGQRMSGVVDEVCPGNLYRLEAFAFDDPRMEAGPWWWVGGCGEAVQQSRSHLADATKAPVFFGGAAGQWIRTWGVLWLPVAMTLPWWIAWLIQSYER